MGTILNQITSLLVEPSGSMVYHLVIAFLFISILQPALSFIPTEGGEQQRKRLFTGVILLIASRLMVFAFSLAAIMQTSIVSASLGVIELVVLALDLVIIIWLFAFPHDNKAGDLGLTLFALGIITAGIVSAIYWSLSGVGRDLVLSPLATGWQIITLGITVIGLVTLLRSKSPARFQGIIMLVILLIGEGLQLAIPPTSGDLYPISRLAHLVAFPLLVGILQNYFLPADAKAREPRHTFAPVEFTPQAIEEMKEEKVDVSNLVTAPLDSSILEDVADSNGDPQASANKALALHIYQNGLALASASTPKQICQLFTRLTAHALVADLCLLLTPPDQNQQVHLICGYDLIVQEGLQSTSFDSSLIPRFDKVFSTGRPIIVIDQGNEKMLELARVLQVKEVNNLLAYPALNQEGQVIAAVVVVSPYSKHLWDANDQEYLKAAAPAINAAMQKALAPQQNARSVENLQEKLDLSNTDLQRLESEREELERRVAELTSKLNGTDSTSELNNDLLDQKAALEAALQQTEEENQALEARVDLLITKAKALAEEHVHLLEENERLASQGQAPQETQAQIDALNHANEDLARQKLELDKQTEEMAIRMAELTEENRTLMLNLNQVKTSGRGKQSPEDAQALQNALNQTQEVQNQLDETREMLDSLLEFRSGSSNSLVPEEQAEVIASISQELRQPLSSISGYTDLLISESVGILGALQKKFLERVKASTERMHQLIDDLIQVATLDSGNYLFTVQPMDLMDVIDTAIETTSTQFREKEISLRVDIHNDLPKLHTDKDALQQILLHLMNNAGAATPVKGEILIRATMYDKTQDDVILLSVTDTGGGIPKEDLPRVFSRLYRADNPLIEGVGDTGVGLSIAKTLTEALGGRIWVESAAGTGSTFSILLPVSSPALAAQEGQSI